MPLLNTASKIYQGSSLATKVYQGSVKVWPPAAAFAPSDITGLTGWWDADDASTFTYSSSTVVSQWRDKSGNAIHFNQATVSLQPNRNATLNGKTTLRFDGVDDYMDTAAYTLPQPMTIFFTFDNSAGDTMDQGWFSSVGGSLQTYIGAGTLSIYAGTGFVNAAGVGVSHPHVWTFTINGASSTIHRDGALDSGAANPGSSGTTTGFRLSERLLAAGYRLNGPLAEVIVYNRALSTTERQQVEAYLKTKWGTP